MHLRVTDPRKLRPALRRDGRRTSFGGGRRSRRQVQPGRICDGLVDREFGVPSDQQSLGPGTRARGIEWWLGSGGRGERGTGGLGNGYRRIGPATGGALRCYRTQADVRTSVSLWASGFRILARSDRSPHPLGRRRRVAPWRHCRSRSARFHERSRADRKLSPATAARRLQTPNWHPA